MPEDDNVQSEVRVLTYGDDTYDLDMLLNRAKAGWESYAKSRIRGYSGHNKKVYDLAFDEFTNALDSGDILRDEANGVWNVFGDFDVNKYQRKKDFDPYGYIGSYYTHLIMNTSPYLSPEEEARRKEDDKKYDWEDGKGLAKQLYKNLFGSDSTPSPKVFLNLADYSGKNEIIANAFNSIDFRNGFKNMDISEDDIKWLENYRDAIVVAAKEGKLNELENYDLDKFCRFFDWQKLFRKSSVEKEAENQLKVNDYIDAKNDEAYKAFMTNIYLYLTTNFGDAYSYSPRSLIPTIQCDSEIPKLKIDYDAISKSPELEKTFYDMFFNPNGTTSIQGLSFKNSSILMALANLLISDGKMWLHGNFGYLFPNDIFNIKGVYYSYFPETHQIASFPMIDIAAYDLAKQLLSVGNSNITNDLKDDFNQIYGIHDVPTKALGGHVIKAESGWNTFINKYPELKEITLDDFILSLPWSTELVSITLDENSNLIFANPIVSTESATSNSETGGNLYVINGTGENYAESNNKELLKIIEDLPGYKAFRDAMFSYDENTNKHTLTDIGKAYFKENKKNLPAWMYDENGDVLDQIPKEGQSSGYYVPGKNANGIKDYDYGDLYGYLFGTDKDHPGLFFNQLNGALHNSFKKYGDVYYIEDDNGKRHYYSKDVLDKYGIKYDTVNGYYSDVGQFAYLSLHPIQDESLSSTQKGGTLASTVRNNLQTGNQSTGTIVNTYLPGKPFNLDLRQSIWDKITPRVYGLERLAALWRGNKKAYEDNKQIPIVLPSMRFDEIYRGDMPSVWAANLRGASAMHSTPYTADATLNALIDQSNWGKWADENRAGLDTDTKARAASEDKVVALAKENKTNEHTTTTLNLTNIFTQENADATEKSNLDLALHNLFGQWVKEGLQYNDLSIALAESDRRSLLKLVAPIGTAQILRYFNNMIEDAGKAYMQKYNLTEDLLADDKTFQDWVKKALNMMEELIWTNYLKGFNNFSITGVTLADIERLTNEGKNLKRAAKHGGRLIARKYGIR